MTERWETVYTGVPSSIWAHQSALEAEGIPTFVPDEWMKTWDPMVTAPSSLDAQLQVPSSQVDAAREILAVSRVRRVPSDPASQADRIAVRIGFASALLVLAPLTFVLAPSYFAAARRAGRRPRNHFVAIVALVLASVVLITALFGILRAGPGFPWGF